MTPAQKKALADYQAAIDGYRDNGPAQHDVAATLTSEDLGPSEMAGIETDPRYSEYEMAALKELEDASQNGFTAQDKADMSRAESDLNRQHHGRMGAIQQNMQSRGMGGSGMDIMAQLQSAQDANDTAALRDLEREGAMQDRKSQATRDLGGMSMSMQQRDWQQAAAKAQAQDQINRFNNQNRNSATQWNANNVQGVSNANVGVNNTYSHNSMGAGMQGAQMQYNAATEDENRRILEEQEKKRRKAAQKQAVGQTVGMVAGGVGGAMVGGPMGASMGAQAGGQLGGAVASYAHGGRVPGEAPFPGDDPRNDVVPAVLSPGEEVESREQVATQDAVADLLQAVASLHKARGKK